MIVRSAVLLLTAALAAAGCGAERPAFTAPGILFVPTPDAVGAQMLRLAGVTSRDVVYDLGSGDGRVVIIAAREFGARGVGVEIEPALVQTSREVAAKSGVADRTQFLWQDIFVADVREATVVTLYLGESLNVKLRPKLLAELRPGTRIVSHDFSMGDWPADRTILARGPDRDHVLRLWHVPANVAGRWRVTLRGRASVLTLEQRFQSLRGALEAPGPLMVTGQLAGDDVTLTAGDLVLQGRVDSDRMGGRATAGGAAAGDWTAERAR